MKNIMKIGAAVMIAASTIIISCGKYEDGPKISLASKTSRMAGSWHISKYYEDGVDKTDIYRQAFESETFTYEKDGKYSTTQKLVPTLGGLTLTDNGTWEFIEKKEMYTMLSSQAQATADTMKILRLKSKELWIQSPTGKPVVKIELVQ